MDSVVESVAVENRGLLNNADQGGKRQVTVISKEDFEAVAAELGMAVDPSLRRANLMVGGLDLVQSRGRILRIGDLRLEIYGETRPCERMDEALPGLRRALEPAWRGGVYGVVLNDASIRVGDQAFWEESADSADLDRG